MEILENGLHSFRKAIQNLKTVDEITGTERELVVKDIILGLHHSIETLFKYIIQENNELLVYKNLDEYFSVKVNQITKKGTQIFKGHTITFIEAIQRAVVLNNIAMDETKYGSFERINAVRNAITHHQYDLSNKQITYLITQVITVVFPIYKDLIPNFSEYVKKHDLNLIGNTQVKEFHVWKFIRYFALYKKFVDARTEIDRMKSTSGEFNTKLKSINKEPYISYHECPCCEKNFFMKDYIVWENTEEKGYAGNCLLCNISFDKEDTYFLYLLSLDYNSFNEKLNKFTYSNPFVNELLEDEKLEEKLTQEELNDIKNIIYSHKESRETLARCTNTYLHYKLNDILEDYAENWVSSYDAAEMDNGLYLGKISDSFEMTIGELTEENKESLKKVMGNFKALELTKEFYNKAFDSKYPFHFNASHPDPNDDNEEKEIEIEITVTLSNQLFSLYLI
ncbi:MAG: hypothetical protein ACI35O_02635 [Bacillaceae bacterium]